MNKVTVPCACGCGKFKQIWLNVYMRNPIALRFIDEAHRSIYRLNLSKHNKELKSKTI